MKKNKKFDFYSLDEIKKQNCSYNVIFGERSNGKTYAVLKEIIEQYYNNGVKTAYIRRYDEYITGSKAKQVFSNLTSKKIKVKSEYISEVQRITNMEYDSVVYFSGAWYLANYDENLDKFIKQKEPFMYGFALNTSESYKSSAYPDIGIVFFEEFLTRSHYLIDEYVIFSNLLSTTVRLNEKVRIYLVGNTVDKNSIYFREMGLHKVTQMKKGEIKIYTYNNKKLRVAVEYSDSIATEKPTDFLFAFDNPKLKMITTGEWEIGNYPHLPVKYKPKNVLYEYFIKYNDDILHCEIILVDDKYFTYVHQKTTPIKDKKENIVFQEEFSPLPNIRRCINNCYDKIGKMIYSFYIKEHVFYQDNEVGEKMRHYLDWCETARLELRK